MRQHWIKFSERVDALTLRERITMFLASAAVLVFLAFHFFIGPAMARQKSLNKAIVGKQERMTALANEGTATMQAGAHDPDAPQREKLERLRSEIAATGEKLRTMQKGMVPPEHVAPLLESIMKANSNLKMIGLKTLPVTGLSETIPSLRLPIPVAPAEAKLAAPGGTGALTPESLIADAIVKTKTINEMPPVAAAKAEPQKAPELVYRHGVELTVQGSYQDMLNFLAALERMPTQLFWGRASLDAQDHQQARLTVTVFTLSFDQNWMKL